MRGARRLWPQRAVGLVALLVVAAGAGAAAQPAGVGAAAQPAGAGAAAQLDGAGAAGQPAGVGAAAQLAGAGAAAQPAGVRAAAQPAGSGAAAQAAGGSGFEGGFYAGTFGDGVPIAGNFFRGPSGGAQQRIWGEYWYATSIDAMTLDGRVGEGGRLSLREMAPAPRTGGLGLETGRIEGRLEEGDRVAEGTWRSADGKRSAPFRLERLAVYRWVQEHPAERAQREAPLSGFSWRYPEFEDPRWVPLNDLLEATARAALAEYEQEIAEESEGAPVGRVLDLPAAYTLAAVQLVTDTLVSIRYDRTEYWPGAVHPNQCRYGASYSVPDDGVTPPVAVELRDLLELSPDCERLLLRLLEGDLRRRGAGDPEAAFLGPFSLLRRGILFHYAPFDVGSYDEGAWNVYIPYGSLARCIPESSPLQELLREPGAGPRR